MHDGYYGYGNISPVYVVRRLLGIMRDVIDWLADFFYPVEFRNHMTSLKTLREGNRELRDALAAANARAEAAEARAERLENELSEVVAYGGYYADIENRLPPEGQVVKVIASSTHGVDDFTVLRLDEKWHFASDPPREVPGEFEVIRIKPWDVKRFGASYDEEF